MKGEGGRKHESSSDEALMAAARAGDADAYANLVRRYEGPLYGYLRRMTGNAADAQDLFQEAFLRVHRHRRRYRVGEPFKPWLYRIATNLALDLIRKRGRRKEESLEGHDADQRAAEDPRDTAIATETAERVTTALAELPETHRAVFLMARYDGLAYAEISKILGIPVGTVKSRMNKAVSMLMAAAEDAES